MLELNQFPECCGIFIVSDINSNSRTIKSSIKRYITQFTDKRSYLLAVLNKDQIKSGIEKTKKTRSILSKRK